MPDRVLNFFYLQRKGEGCDGESAVLIHNWLLTYFPFYSMLRKSTFLEICGVKFGFFKLTQSLQFQETPKKQQSKPITRFYPDLLICCQESSSMTKRNATTFAVIPVKHFKFNLLANLSKIWKSWYDIPLPSCSSSFVYFLYLKSENSNMRFLCFFLCCLRKTHNNTFNIVESKDTINC